jgi:uncharacterized protein (TIGR00369 family)
MDEFNDDQHCFVCGSENPAGLGVQFREHRAGPGVEAEVRFPAHLQGWQAVVHGGLLATVLDETMIKAAAFQGLKCVTAELTVKYRSPAATGVQYRLVGRILDAHGRLVTAESSLEDASGLVCARATGKLFKIRDAPAS